MRRHLSVISVLALMGLAACQPNPPATDPVPPVIASFTATPASGPAPFNTGLQWSISDANYDAMSCTLDTDGDGIFETSVPSCTSWSARTASFPVPGVHTLSLRVTDGNTAPVTSTLVVAATAPTAETFHIDFRLNGSMTPSQQAVFATAATRWEQVVKAGLPDVALTLGANECDTGTPAFAGTVDDVMIDASIVPIDGVGGILGSAGPCYVRTGDKLPIYGTMRFDSADVAQLEANGEFPAVVLHEIGHILGLGTVWTSLGLLSGSGTIDPRFNGPVAMGEWQAIGGFGSVPVEANGGPGTADSHWSETTFNNELMTGYIDAGSNPLSRITAGQFADLGYSVDLGAADPYGLPALRAPSTGNQQPVPPVQLLTPRHSI